MSQDDRAALFDAWAADYNTTVANADGFPFAGYRQVLETILDVTTPQPAMRILDVGAGTGNLASRFVAQQCAVTGVDFSPRMLAAARTAVPDATFLHLDLLGSWSPLEAQRFDRIVSAYVLHEFDLATKVHIVSEFVRHHLHAGGSLIVDDIAFSTAEARAEAEQRWHERWDEDEDYWVADETLALFERQGLTGEYWQITPFSGVFQFVPAAASR